MVETGALKEFVNQQRSTFVNLLGMPQPAQVENEDRQILRLIKLNSPDEPAKPVGKKLPGIKDLLDSNVDDKSQYILDELKQELMENGGYMNSFTRDHMNKSAIRAQPAQPFQSKSAFLNKRKGIGNIDVFFDNQVSDLTVH